MKTPTKSPTPSLLQREGEVRQNVSSASIDLLGLKDPVGLDLENPTGFLKPSRIGAALPPLRRGLGWGFCGLLLFLNACITEYRATGIEELADILVVEGVITDEETIITLSRSVYLTEETSRQVPVNNAEVFVECDDGPPFRMDPPNQDYFPPRYLIKTGQLDLNRQYRLKIKIEDQEYRSDFSPPVKTPEIDSVFWSKEGPGHPVRIHVATHSPDNSILYYRWSYREDWEINSEMRLEDYPYYCWSWEKSKNLLIGSAEKTVFGKLTDILASIPPTSSKLSVLYRIDVKQNAIRKQAYDYFANIKKNAEQTGSIFAPIPSELRGNIKCDTDADRPVIGFVDVSTTTQKRRYIKRSDNVYETPRSDCEAIPRDSLLIWYEGTIPEDRYIQFDPLDTTMYIHIKCVDCTKNNATERKPDDWPNDH